MTASTTDLVGICGLGNMGLAVAQQIGAARPVLGFDLDADRRHLAADSGIEVVDSLDGLASCTTIVLSLPNPAASLATVRTLGPLLAKGSLFIETSTVTPDDVHTIDTEASAHGLDTIEAAILSGVGQMHDGKATLLVGGEADLVTRTRPLLDLFGEKVIIQGALGAGMAAKVINNAVAHAVMVVLVEAFEMARATGVPAQNLIDLLSADDGGLVRPLTHRIVDRVIPGKFDGGMPCEAARKDSTLALQTATRAGVPLYALPAAHSVYELAVGAGLGRQDYAVIATLWDQWRSADPATPAS